MQFRVAVDEFLRFCALERQLSEHTVHAYTADLNDFQRWVKLDPAASDVTTEMLKSYLQDMVGI
jgi:site-specific recombinase XerD